MKRLYYNEAKRILPILQAISEGKTIQWKNLGMWRDIDGDNEGLFIDTLISDTDNYRIKPSPTYRPFVNAEECWNEMLKHQPFGYLKDKGSDKHFVLLTYIDGNNIGLNGNNGWEFEGVFNIYTFADGSAFGVKVEGKEE